MSTKIQTILILLFSAVIYLMLSYLVTTVVVNSRFRETERRYMKVIQENVIDKHNDDIRRLKMELDGREEVETE